MSVRDFDLRTSSNAESEGAVTKGGSTGCKPNQTIDKSADAVILKTQRRLQKKKTAAANSIHAQSVQTRRDETRCIYADISAELTPYSADLVEKQFSASYAYLLFRADAETFYVKRESYKIRPQQWTDPKFYTFFVPHFERTRVVRVETDKNGSSCLCCSCKMYQRKGIVCWHIYRVLCCPRPQPQDAVIRWHKIYGYFYGRDEELTALFDSSIDNEPIGPDADTIGLNEMWPVGVIARSHSSLQASNA